jgi:SPP1 family predicted phage head-tail adaptor
VSAWVEHAVVWADIRDQSGRELVAAGQVVADATTQIIIRFRGDVAAGMRAVEVVTGRIYDITAVLSDARRTKETLVARHGVSHG